MVDKVEPVLGRTALSDFHRTLHVDASAILKNWIPSGYTPTDGGGLNLNVAAGRAFLAGATADRDIATVLALTDATTNHVWVYIDDGLDDGIVYFLVNTTGTAPTQGPFHKIATVTTAGGGITLITDERLLTPELSGGLRVVGLLQALADLEVTGDFDLLAGKILSDATLFQLRNLADSAYKSLGLDNVELRGGKLLSDATEYELRNLADSAFKNLHILDLVVDGLVDGVDIAAHESAFLDHNLRHEPGGADPMAVDAAVGVGSLRTLGTGALQAKPGDAGVDLHATTHESGGSDVLDGGLTPDFLNFADRTADPTLAAGLQWMRTDDDEMRVSPDGTKIRTLLSDDGQSPFGSGKDGTVTISSNQTLSVDTEYENLTINGGVTFTLDEAVIFVKNKLIINGIIDADGLGGIGATASAGVGGTDTYPAPDGNAITAFEGAGGGGGGAGLGAGGDGGNGGGSVLIWARSIEGNGTIRSRGLTGTSGLAGGGGGGGGGGGIIYVRCRYWRFTGTIQTGGGAGGAGGLNAIGGGVDQAGGAGGATLKVGGTGGSGGGGNGGTGNAPDTDVPEGGSGGGGGGGTSASSGTGGTGGVGGAGQLLRYLG